jgi:hypothetical protein
MTIEKQDSNVVGLNIARAQPDGTLGANPVFRQREPNTFSDMGGDYKSTARRPFNPTRQRRKGTIVDLDAKGGYTEDVTASNMVDIVEDAFYANAHRKPNQTGVAAVAATDDYTVGDSTGFHVNSLILGSGFANAANNGLHVLDAITDGTHISTADALVDEALNAEATVEVVGFQFPASDVALTVVGGVLRLTSATVDMTTLGMIPGEWGFLGGDAAGTHFDDMPPAYVRVSAVAADHIDFDKTSATAAADAGAGKTIRLFFGTVVRNEADPDLIVRHELYVERLLGNDGDGVQSEVIERAIVDELNWTSPLAEKVNVDIKLMGLAHTTYTGAEGPLSAQPGATLLPAFGEDAINTSSNLFRARLNIVDGTLSPTPLFARVTEWNMDFKNNASIDKAQGTLGGFDSTAGMFEVSGKIKAYFTTVAAISAIRNNNDVTFDAIYSKNNRAIALDIPLIQLGGGLATIEMDKPIFLPLNMDAAQHPFGHTALVTFFSYVPNAALA